MRILVVGATGVLGRHVVPRLLERGHAVRAVVRREEQAQSLRFLGAEPVSGDILDPASLAGAAAGCDAALHLATAIPKPGEAPDWGRNDRIRREGTANLLAAAAAAGVRRYVQQSITFVYGDHGAASVDEATPLRPPAFARSAEDMEDLVRGSALGWVILRGGLLYGPGTGREAGWWAAARAGTLRAAGTGDGLLSLVHVADLARAVVAATQAAPVGGIYNVVDDAPVAERVLYGYVAARAGAPAPGAGGEPFLPSLGVSNARLRRDLGWSPAYPSYRSGLAGVE